MSERMDLRVLPLFSGLTAAESEDLASSCSFYELEDGEPLFALGDPPDHLYVVRSGGLRLSCRARPGVEVVVGEATKGDIVGEMAILDPAPRSATATAMGRTEILCLSGSAFARLLDEAHPAARSIITEIRMDTCTRLRHLDERLDAIFSQADASPGSGGLFERLQAIWVAMMGGQRT
jgi:CRP/FNR family cyclic AMP-dependent transcriptional regulator